MATETRALGYASCVPHAEDNIFHICASDGPWDMDSIHPFCRDKFSGKSFSLYSHALPSFPATLVLSLRARLRHRGWFSLATLLVNPIDQSILLQSNSSSDQQISMAVHAQPASFADPDKLQPFGDGAYLPGEEVEEHWVNLLPDQDDTLSKGESSWS